jgi:hypothetical protein
MHVGTRASHLKVKCRWSCADFPIRLARQDSRGSSRQVKHRSHPISWSGPSCRPPLASQVFLFRTLHPHYTVARMTVLLAQQGRILLQRWASQKSSIASGRVVQLLRVANVHISSRAPSQSPTHSNDSILPPTRRPFATRPGRPKGHTGRTSASKKPATSKTSNSTTAKKTAKPKTKAKPKPKKKKAVAAKPKPKKRVARPLSEAGKQRRERKIHAAKVKDLKRAALSPPKKLPDNAWKVYLSEQAKAKTSSDSVTSVAKSASVEFKNFTLEQKEVLPLRNGFLDFQLTILAL